MPIVKDKDHTENYVVMHNRVLEEESLSWEAKGVLAYLLSRPSDWQPSVSHIGQQGGIGRTKARRIFAELEEAGYLKKSQARTHKGAFGIAEVFVFETPRKDMENVVKLPRVDQNPIAVNPTTVNPTTANRETVGNPLISTDLISTDNKQVLKEKGEKKKRFSPPTQQEVEDHMLTKGADFDQARSWAEDFVDFYASKDWMVGKNKMKSWTHAASRWAKQNREKSNGTSVRNSKTSGTSIEHTATDTSWGGTWPN